MIDAEAPKRRSARRRYIGLAATLGVGISLSVSAFLVAQERQQQYIRTQFEWLAAERALSVEHDIGDELDVLHSIAALFAASRLVEREEFGTFAGSVLSRRPGVRALAWASRQPGPDQSSRFRLRYIEPSTADVDALGGDIGAWHTWRKELRRAPGSMGPIVTRRVRLGQLMLPPSRYAALLPVFTGGIGRDRAAARPEEPQGFLVAVFDASLIVEAALAPFNSSPIGIDVALYHGTAASDDALLHARPSPLPRAMQLPGVSPLGPPLRYVRTFNAGAQRWAIVCTAAPQFLAAHPIRQPWIVLAIGLLSTAGLAALVWSLIRRAELVENMVRQRTAELSLANRQLAEEIVERRRVDEELCRARDDLELRVEQRTADLSRVVSELERANHLKSEFVSTMSHELRTPLNVILGFVEMARDTSLTADECANCLDRIAIAGRELFEMIQSTLDIGKLEAGRDEPRLESIALPEWWAALARDCACLPRDELVSLEWSSDVPEIVFATDPRKLGHALRNVVGNALKFTQRGTVTITVGRNSEGLVFRVEDTGIGIRPQDLEVIFEMFRQGDGSDSRKHRGSGLGLYIARRVVEQLGGRIGVVSAVGQGSVFTIALPMSGETVRVPSRARASAMGSAAIWPKVEIWRRTARAAGSGTAS